MVSTQTDELLRRGGMAKLSRRPADDVDETDNEPRVDISKYNGVLDPAGVETLGQRLAKQLLPLQVNAVLVWEDIEDLVLAHVVARELGVAVVRAFDDGGLVRSEGVIEPGNNVVVLSDTFRDGTVVRALGSLIELHKAHLVAFASLVDFTLVGVDTSAMVSLGLPLADTAEKGGR